MKRHWASCDITHHPGCNTRWLDERALSILLLLWQGPLKQVCLELLSPAPLLRLERKQQAGPRRVATGWGTRLRFLRQVLLRRCWSRGVGVAHGLKSRSSNISDS